MEHNPRPDKHIWLTLEEVDEGFEARIADDGKGIPDTVKDGLFDVSRRYGGVSLHQTKEIVDKYGGRIKVTDRVPGTPEEGAEFCIWLPRANR